MTYPNGSLVVYFSDHGLIEFGTVIELDFRNYLGTEKYLMGYWVSFGQSRWPMFLRKNEVRIPTSEELRTYTLRQLSK